MFIGKFAKKLNVKLALSALAIGLSCASTAAYSVPDATTDGIPAVKSWAWQRVLDAQNSFSGNRHGSPGFWGSEIVYQIQIDRFNNGDPSNDALNLAPGEPGDLSQGILWNVQGIRHGGDLQGIIQRLDYLKDLGVTSLWVTPIIKNNDYHGYCTSDFTQIDPGFGTNEKFREMVREAHNRGIKVVMDIVINHMCDRNTGYSKKPGHWSGWNESSAHYQCANDLDRKNWLGESGGSSHQGELGFGNSFFPAFKHQDFFNRCGGNSQQDMESEFPVSIYGDFASVMFDFNTRNWDFQDIFTNLHLYWISYADVDGFRLDAAKHVSEDFLAYFSTRTREYARSIGKNNFYIVGEVAGSAPLIGRRIGRMFSGNDVPQTLRNRVANMGKTWSDLPGMTAAYDFAHGGRGRGAIRNERWIKEINDHFFDPYYQTIAAQSDARLNWNVLEIHDWPRIVQGAHKDNPWKSRLATSYLASAQGTPVLYYGMEQGLNGDCHTGPGKINVGSTDAANQVIATCGSHDHALYRQDMFISGPWRLGSTVSSINGNTYIGKTTRTAWENWKTDPYLKRDHDVYQSTRRYNWIRQSCDALRFGWTTTRFADTANEGIYVFSRVDNFKEAVVIMNNSPGNRFIPTVQSNSSNTQYKLLTDGFVSAWSGGDGKINFGSLQIPGNTVWIMVPAGNHGPWRDHIKSHVCKDNPVDPREPADPVTNLPPVARAGADIEVNVGDVVQFNGGTSSDPDGTIALHEWSNGMTGATPTRTYNAPGSYPVTLTVTDNKGAKASDEVVVTVRAPGPTDWRRTVVFIYGQTNSGQDMFMRGGIDWDYSKNVRNVDCGATPEAKWLCAIPLKHRVMINDHERAYDRWLDWHGKEAGQQQTSKVIEGSPLVWTTNNASNPKKVAVDGYGYTPLNTYGDHYWMLDVDIDCSKTVNGWVELRTYISGGPGWEPNVTQPGAPYASPNHFGQCGKINVFKRGESNPVVIKDF